MPPATASQQETSSQNLATIILAAGLGRRMGKMGPKAFLRINGITFMERCVARCRQAGIRRIVVVVNPSIHAKTAGLLSGVPIVLNENPDEGMLSSIKLGVRRLDNHVTGIMIVPVDHPLVTTKTFEVLAEEHARFPNSICQPEYHGKHGHPIIFPKDLFGELLDVPAAQSARWVLRKYPDLRRLVQVDDPGVVLQINTPKDYNELVRDQFQG